MEPFDRHEGCNDLRWSWCCQSKQILVAVASNLTVYHWTVCWFRGAMQARVSRQHYMNVRESCLSIPLTRNVILEAVSHIGKRCLSTISEICIDRRWYWLSWRWEKRYPSCTSNGLEKCERNLTLWVILKSPYNYLNCLTVQCKAGTSEIKGRWRRCFLLLVCSSPINTQPWEWLFGVELTDAVKSGSV